MKKLLICLFILLLTLVSAEPAHSTDFDSGMAAANYLDEYQAKQGRSDGVRKGVLFLILGAGGIALGIKLNKKNKP